MMTFHVMLHALSVAVVDADTPQKAVELVDKNRSLLKPLNDEFTVHTRQEKDLN